MIIAFDTTWAEDRIKEPEIEAMPYRNIINSGIICNLSDEYNVLVKAIDKHINDLKYIIGCQ